MSTLNKDQIDEIKAFFEQAAYSEEDNSFAQLAKLLSMSEDEFNVMAPIVADSFQKQLNTVNDKTTFVTAMKAEGVTYEDFLLAVKEISELSATELNLSENKKDFLVQLLACFANAYGDIEGIAKAIIQIPTEKLSEDVNIPTYATVGAAGADVYANEDVTIEPGETKIIPTGLKLEIPHGYAVLVQMRSGLAAKTKLRLANSLGLIDSDYRGEVGVILENTAPRIEDLTFNEDGTMSSILYGQSYTISKGERIAQLRLVEAPKMNFIKVDKVNDTIRGEGGYGSTGK